MGKILKKNKKLSNFHLFRQKTQFMVKNKSFSKLNTQFFITEPKKNKTK